MSGPKGDPIPIESLTPVGRNDPRVQTQFDGQTLPSAPSMRRVKPAPFRRESVNLDRHHRVWMQCRADAIEIGEMVAGLGRVAGREVKVRRAPKWEVFGLIPTVDEIPPELFEPVAVSTDIELTSVGGAVVTYDAADSVRTFRKEEAGT